MLSCKIIFYVSQMQVPSQIYIWLASFLPFCGLSLHFLEAQKYLILMKSNVSIFFSFVACAFSVLSQKALSNPWSQRFSPVFSSKSLTVLVLYLSLWCILSYFLYMVFRRSPISFSCMWAFNCPNTICWKDLFIHI